jgi:hypothetical protein
MSEALRFVFAGDRTYDEIEEGFDLGRRGGAYYLASGFLPTFLKVVNELANETASLILIAAGVFADTGSMSVGHLSTLSARGASSSS